VADVPGWEDFEMPELDEWRWRAVAQAAANVVISGLVGRNLFPLPIGERDPLVQAAW